MKLSTAKNQHVRRRYVSPKNKIKSQSMITWSKPKLCKKYKGLLFLQVRECWSRVKEEPSEMLLNFGGDSTTGSNQAAINPFVVSVLA